MQRWTAPLPNDQPPPTEPHPLQLPADRGERRSQKMQAGGRKRGFWENKHKSCFLGTRLLTLELLILLHTCSNIKTYIFLVRIFCFYCKYIYKRFFKDSTNTWQDQNRMEKSSFDTEYRVMTPGEQWDKMVLLLIIWPKIFCFVYCLKRFI